MSNNDDSKLDATTDEGLKKMTKSEMSSFLVEKGVFPKGTEDLYEGLTSEMLEKLILHYQETSSNKEDKPSEPEIPANSVAIIESRKLKQSVKQAKNLIDVKMGEIKSILDKI